MIHGLKCERDYFENVISGKKQFEIRFCDREYQEGDYLALNEWEQTSAVGGHYTGRSCLVYVDYILREFEGLYEDYCIMSIKPCEVALCDVIRENDIAAPVYENPIEYTGQCDVASECVTCRYYNTDNNDPPCCSCIDGDNYEESDEVDNK